MSQWMIYGANGYTGTLLAHAAAARGLKPVLAGRNTRAITQLGESLGLPHQCFDLHDQQALQQTLADHRVILNCAGPFSATSQPLIDACLATGCHYLDITGEIDAFVAAQARQTDAEQANIVICPGVGFDVIPTDCIAARLKQELPDADRLALGFDSRSALSPGTAKTSRFCSIACRAEIIAPDRSDASTTITPRLSPVIMRFRCGKAPVRGSLRGALSLTSAPWPHTWLASCRCSGG